MRVGHNTWFIKKKSDFPRVGLIKYTFFTECFMFTMTTSENAVAMFNANSHAGRRLTDADR